MVTDGLIALGIKANGEKIIWSIKKLASHLRLVIISANWGKASIDLRKNNPANVFDELVNHSDDL